MVGRQITLLVGVLIAVAVLICGVCGFSAWFAFRGTQRTLSEARQTAQQLLLALQQHNWQATQEAFAPQARTYFTPTQLQRRWQALEQAIGQVQGWGMEDFRIYAGTEGRWVQLRYRLEGKAGVGQLNLRLRSVGERWLVEAMEVGWSGGK